MSMIKFTDGVQFDTSGEPRCERRADGLYVVGNGMLIPVRDEVEAAEEIAKSASKGDNNE